MARAAVLWLRGEGLMSQIAEKKQWQTSSEDSTTGLSERVLGRTFPEQVHHLVQELGFKSQPRFVVTPAALPSGQQGESAGAFCDVHCLFDERDCEGEELLRAKLGEVRGCLGKVKAKEACCERVVPVLEEVKRKRLSAF